MNQTFLLNLMGTKTFPKSPVGMRSSKWLPSKAIAPPYWSKMIRPLILGP